jgi:hypothetical protein
VLVERCGGRMRLCVSAIGEAVNATAAAQPTNAEIRPRTRGNEDCLAVLMNWGGVKCETRTLRRGIMQRPRERCHLRLDCGGFFVELVEEFENAGANIFRHAFSGH